MTCEFLQECLTFTLTGGQAPTDIYLVVTIKRQFREKIPSIKKVKTDADKKKMSKAALCQLDSPI